MPRYACNKENTEKSLSDFELLTYMYEEILKMIILNMYAITVLYFLLMVNVRHISQVRIVFITTPL
jgi:hypothetical protein